MYIYIYMYVYIYIYIHSTLCHCAVLVFVWPSKWPAAICCNICCLSASSLADSPSETSWISLISLISLHCLHRCGNTDLRSAQAVQRLELLVALHNLDALEFRNAYTAPGNTVSNSKQDNVTRARQGCVATTVSLFLLHFLSLVPQLWNTQINPNAYQML